MSANIHSTAIVGKKARLGKNVSIGPYAFIEDTVTIEDNTEIGPFCHITGYTKIGKGCRIFSHAVIGSIPQDLKYQGEKSFLTIGDGNIIREFVTINPGTEKDSETTIGNNNLIMAYSHIAHNCTIGNNNIFANAATLAGYVTVENKVVIGGLAAIHQFCHVGSYAIIGGCSKVIQDIPPYSLCDGHPARIRGINTVGLKRANFPHETIENIRRAFKILFFQGHTLQAAREIITQELPALEEIRCLLEFIAASKRGISR